MYLLRR